MFQRRSTFATGIIVAALGLAGLSSAQATALSAATGDKGGAVPGASTPGTSSALANQDAAWWARQQRLTSFSTWLDKQPGVAAAGYVDSIDDVAHQGTTLLWKGTSPLQQKAISEGHRRGLKVTVRPWAYSSAQIDAGIAKAWKHVATDPSWRGFKVADIVGLDPARPGLTIEGHWASGTKTAAVRPSVTSLARNIDAAIGMKVAVATNSSSTPAFTRSTDLSPFYAAGYMISGGHTCSSGFAVRYAGANHITTARHCTATPYTGRDSTNSYGSSLTTSASGQARVMSAAGGAFNFDGAWNDPNGFRKHVAGLVDLNLNDFVCTSGGNSGVHCNIKITALRVSFNDGFGADSTIRGVQQTAGGISAIQGDSGGTVFTLSGADVLAAGMIQGIDGTLSTGAACGSVHDAGSNLCSRQVLFTSMRTIVNSLGATLTT